MDVVLVVLAFVVLLTGAAFVSQATLGVALVGAACFLAVVARMVQARSQQKRLLVAIERNQNK